MKRPLPPLSIPIFRRNLLTLFVLIYASCLYPLEGSGKDSRSKIFQTLYSLPSSPTQSAKDRNWDACASSFEMVEKSKWNHLRSYSISKFGKPNHNAHDVITSRGRAIPVEAKFTFGFFDKDIEEEPVALFLADSQCKWSLKARGTTNSDGRFSANLEPLPVGIYPARAVLEPSGTMAKFQITVLNPGEPVAVFDIDGTLTLSDGELIYQILRKVFRGEYIPKMRTSAVEVVQLIRAKGYHLVYLTGRPYPLHRMTRSWLANHKFPRGTLILTDSNRESYPAKVGVGTFKAQRIQGLTESELEPVMGFGNAKTDIYAYEEAALPKELTFIIGKHGGKNSTVKIQRYDKSMSEFEKIPDTTENQAFNPNY